jgi:hypothetical protein
MNKFIFLTLVSMLFACSASAQYYPKVTGAGDSIVNAGTKYLTVALDGNVTGASFQVIFTKRSGTVAGKATIEYTIDGINYHRINKDSLIITNISSQKKLWLIDPPSGLTGVRIVVVGTGTSIYLLNPLLYVRRSKT